MAISASALSFDRSSPLRPRPPFAAGTGPIVFNRWFRECACSLVATLVCFTAVAVAPAATNRDLNLGGHVDVQAVVDGFASRRLVALDRIIAAKPPDNFGGTFLSDQIKALAILAQADLTKDYSRVGEANDLLLRFCRQLDQPNWWGRINHGGGLIAMRVLLTYGGRDELLFPATVAKLRDGREPDGRVIPGQSLRHFLPETCFNRHIRIGIHTWKKPFDGAVGYTENHRLQYMVHALLLCQIYGNETYAPPDGPPMPLRSSLPGQADYFGYWKQAFYEYLIGYRKPQIPIEPWQFDEFRHMDWGITEKDGATYTHVFLGDFWFLRDLVDDPVLKKYCEMFIDLILTDYAEEAIHGVYAGAHENSEKHTSRLPGLMAIFSHLLFDQLPYVPAGREYFDWGAWAYVSLLTSDYHPGNQQFPQAIIDLAVNKPAEGYMVREAVGETRDGLPGKPKATWVKPDYSLGFGVKSWNGWGYHAGGAYVATPGESSGQVGLAIIPFGLDDNNRFDLKYSLICPIQSVVGPGAAIIQNGTDQLPSKIWIKDGFEEDFVSRPPWLFFSAQSIAGRKVYTAIRPVLGGHQLDTPRKPGTVILHFQVAPGERLPELANSKVPDDASGKIIKFEQPADYLVWEMSDSDRYPAFEDFKRAVSANPLTVDEEFVAYTSTTGTQLEFDRYDFLRHRIDGRTIDYDNYRYVIKNPWVEWRQNTKRAKIERGPYSAEYDFDPSGTGVFIDQMPAKTLRQ